MGDSREVRTAASEIKFLVEPWRAARIREWARAHLDRDPHGDGPFGDEYRTTSVYFDTGRFDVLERRGSFARAKYRIRRYGDAPTVFLERKLREPGVLAKRRTAAPLDALHRLHAGEDDRAWAGRWFRQRVRARALRPVCRVTYHRVARTAFTNGHQIRLTIDDGLSVVPAADVRFDAANGRPCLEGRAIVELKFRYHVPSMFKLLVERFALQPRPASKYRLAMASLGVMAGAEPAKPSDRIHV